MRGFYTLKNSRPVLRELLPTHAQRHATSSPHARRLLSKSAVEALEGRVLFAAAPSSTLSTTTITSTTAVENVKVIYKDAKGVDLTSIDASDLSITSPGGVALSVSAVTTKSTKAGATVTANYTVQPPSGAWGAADDGSYLVTLNSGKVHDTAAAPLPAASGTFTVSIADTVAPTAQINAPTVTAAGAASYRFTIVYSDNVAIDASTIDAADVTVTGPPGIGALPVQSVTASSGSAKVVTATYTVAAPGGSFGLSDNGTYTIALHARQVTDTAQNPVVARSASFQVNIARDSTPPVASLSAPNITDSSGSGAATTTITAVYTDNLALRTDDFGVGNIRVTGPGGAALSVSGFNVVSSSGTSATVQYTVNAPGGVFDSTDNGAYHVSLVSNQILDASGNPAATTSTTFTVTLTPPDTTPPTAAPAAFDITASGKPEVVTVVYTDNRAVSAASIGSDDLSVTGPGGTLSVASMSASTASNAATITATYTLAIPNSAWTSADNGSYTVTVVPGAVRDTSNNPVTSAVTVFAVNIPVGDPSDPTFAQGASSTTNFVAEGAVVAPSGQIYVAGQRAVSGGMQGVLERLNSDGSLDSSFGSSGIVTTSGATDGWYAVTLQGADHLILAGASAGDFALSRYDLSGNLDSTFSANTGKATADFGTDADVARAVAIAPDGSIIAGGDASGHFAFAKFSADGVLDTTFGQGGRQIFQVGTGADMLGCMVVQSDGKIVGVGASGGNVAVVRARADGSPDASFSSDGEITLTSLAASTDLASPDTSEGVALQADGKILIANHTSDGHFGLMRLSTDGTIDTTFGAAGLATANFGATDDADAVVVQSSGQILVAGTTLTSSSASTAVAAFDTNGNLISTFGQNGLATYDATTLPIAQPQEVSAGNVDFRAFAITQPNGQVIVGASDASEQSQSSQLRRLIVPGSVSTGPTQPGSGTPLGSFGIVNGKKNVRLNVTGADGQISTFSLTNATGMAYQTDSDIRLVISSIVGKTGATLTATARGGSRRIPLGDVSVAGSLARLNAPTADISGTFYVAGALHSASVGILTGNLAVAGAIGNVTAAAVTNGRIFSGANLGADNAFGGGDDTFTAGSIASVRITGALTAGLIAAGLDPGPDATFLTTDDTVTGGAASVIKSIYAKSADDASRFVAGAFKHAALPKVVKSIADDPRFLTT